MNSRAYVCTLLIAVLSGVACKTDPEVAKREYLERGNRFFAEGKYNDASVNYRKALRLDPRYGEAYYRFGLAEMRRDKFETAYTALQRATTLMPQNPAPKVTLADLCLSMYMVDKSRPEILRNQAADLSKQLLASDPNSVDGLRITAHLELLDGQTQEAIATLRRADSVKPMQPDIILPLAQALFRVNQKAEGERLARALIERHKEFAPIYDALYLYYSGEKRWADAEKVLIEKAANSPKEIAYALQLAAFYAQQQRPADMQRVIDGVLKTFPQGQGEVGDFYVRIGRLDDAIRLYQEAARTNEKEKSLYEKKIASTQLQQGKAGDAMASLNRLVSSQPDDTEAVSMRADLRLASGKAEEIDAAIRDLTIVSEKKPDDASVYYNLGRAYQLKKNFELARRQFMEAIKRQKGYLPPRFALAEMDLQTRQYDSALRYANEILTYSPGDQRASILHAAAQIGLRNYDDARSELNKVLQAAPNNLDAQLELGLLETAQKRFAQAEAIFKKLHQPGRPDARAALGLAQIYTAQGQNDKALSVLQAAVASFPNSTELGMEFAETAMRSGQADTAIGQYTKMLAADPKSAFLHLNLGRAYQSKGDMANAIQSFQTAKDLDPSNATVTLFLAQALERSGRKQEAITNYRQILKQQPENPVVLNNLAYLISDTGGNLDEALKLVQQALRKVPQQPNYSDTLGWIYLKKSQVDPAFQVFSNLVEKYPGDPVFRYHLALTLVSKGDKAKAKTELTTALSNKPAREDEQKIRELLAKIG
jgi:tetratricopeptide (TPR) repeat protein